MPEPIMAPMPSAVSDHGPSVFCKRWPGVSDSDIKEPARSEPNQSTTAGEGAGRGFPPAGGAGHGQHGNPCLRRTGAHNGHFESTCYNPSLLFNGEGDCLAAKLRPGNVHSAEDWDEVLLPETERQQALGKEVVFRADAAFAKPEIYEAMEERGVKYAIRLPANAGLKRDLNEAAVRRTHSRVAEPTVGLI